MRFLADESCDFAAVQALRAAGHAEFAVAEVARGVPDSAVIERARSEMRILLTEDKDFGQLVFAAARRTAGVIFFRWPVAARSMLGATIVEPAVAHGETLAGSFVVVEPGRIRISR